MIRRHAEWMFKEHTMDAEKDSVAADEAHHCRIGDVVTTLETISSPDITYRLSAFSSLQSGRGLLILPRFACVAWG
jgi:hypothetical protein